MKKTLTLVALCALVSTSVFAKLFTVTYNTSCGVSFTVSGPTVLNAVQMTANMYYYQLLGCGSIPEKHAIEIS